ncbi:MAG: hypothetical protein U1E89_14285 [Burkholderiaceae bacterium]
MFQKAWAASGSFWPRSNTRYLSGPATAVAKMAELREEFEQALRGVYGQGASLLRSRVRGADLPDDLWYLRTEIFEQVSRAISQAEAAARLRDLDALFEPVRGRTRIGGAR